MTAPARGGNQSEDDNGKARQRGDKRADKRADKRSDRRTDRSAEPKGSTRTNRRVRVRSTSAERAYERKRERGRRSSEEGRPTGGEKRSKGGGSGAGPHEPSARDVLLGSGALRSGKDALRGLTNRIATSRAPFVGTVVVVLVTGIVATLWLSIAAVGNSYRIQESKQRVQALSERKEDLLRSVSRMSSISEIRRRAAEMNMVPVSEVARLVPQPDGSVRVVGDPQPAEAPKPPPKRGGGAPDRSGGGADGGGDSPNGGTRRQPDASPEDSGQSSSDEPSVG